MIEFYSGLLYPGIVHGFPVRTVEHVPPLARRPYHFLFRPRSGLHFAVNHLRIRIQLSGRNIASLVRYLDEVPEVGGEVASRRSAETFDQPRIVAFPDDGIVYLLLSRPQPILAEGLCRHDGGKG